MTDWQRLWRVELPLAAPLLMAGVRTAAVWVIGAATLSTPVGQISLGNYIFSGLQMQDWVSVLFGCIAAAALALIVDQLLGADRDRTGARAAVGASPRASPRSPSASPSRRCPLGRGAAASYVVGGKNFSEQFILAELMSARIADAGRRRSAAHGARLGHRVPRARERRHRCLRRLQRHDLGQCHAAHRRAARATRCSPRSARGSQTQHGIAMLGALGLRERLRARDAARSSRAARHRHDRRSRGACAELDDRRRLRVLRRGPNGQRCGSATGSSSRAAASSSRHSCIRPSSTARST